MVEVVGMVEGRWKVGVKSLNGIKAPPIFHVTEVAAARPKAPFSLINIHRRLSWRTSLPRYVSASA